MIVYRVIASFRAEPIGLDLSIGDIVYRYSNDSMVVFAVNPPPVPDPETNFIGGTEWTNDAFYAWACNASQAFLNAVGTIADPSGGSSVVSDSVAIGNGVDFVAVTFAVPLSAVPSSIVTTVRKVDQNGDNIFATIRDDSVTVNGFTVDLSASTPGLGYYLDYQAT